MNDTDKTFDKRDTMLLAGLFLLVIGSWFVWPPLCAIVPGIVLTGVAVFGVR